MQRTASLPATAPATLPIVTGRRPPQPDTPLPQSRIQTRLSGVAPGLVIVSVSRPVQRSPRSLPRSARS